MAKVYDEGDGLIPHLARHWWALALRGLVAILFGVLAFAWPGLTVAVLVIVFGAYTFVDDIIAIATAIRAAGREPRWWTLLSAGIRDILAGLAAIVWPQSRRWSYST